LRESSLLRSFPGPHFPSLSSFLLPFGPGYSILQPQRSSKILQSGRASGRKSGVRRKERGGKGKGNATSIISWSGSKQIASRRVDPAVYGDLISYEAE